MQATVTPTLPEIFSLEAAAAIAIAALIAVAIALMVGSLTRRLLLLFPALDLAGVKLTVGLHPEEITRWATESGARILFLILLALAANRFAASVIRNAEHEIAEGDDHRTVERRKRLQTVGATSR